MVGSEGERGGGYVGRWRGGVGGWVGGGGLGASRLPLGQWSKASVGPVVKSFRWASGQKLPLGQWSKASVGPVVKSLAVRSDSAVKRYDQEVLPIFTTGQIVGPLPEWGATSREGLEAGI